MLIRSTWTLSVSEVTVLPVAYPLAFSKILHQRLLPFVSSGLPSTGCSWLMGPYERSRDFITLHPDCTYEFVLCGLQEQSSTAIANLTLDPKLDLLGATLHIGDRQDIRSSYEQLYGRHVAQEPQPTQQFQLQFLTPTAFSQNKIQLPLPVPLLMFRSWLDRWNHFSSVFLGGDELLGYIQDAVALKRHRIHSQGFPIHQGSVSGFVGDIHLITLNRTDPLLTNVVHLLVQYASFAGTGIKTRLGMGQTRLISTPQSEQGDNHA